MKRSAFALVFLLVGACALPASHLRDVAPVDSTRHGGGESVLWLGLAAFFALWVIPGAGKIIRGDP